ncbi:glucokinase [Sphingomonas sp. Y38-1Y]|uniref:glucokinase n=1 Tax=Sphingomonas sp. Y38-1Y TaxID=3078265 RepID=UPI0028E7B595|nr:ROK family protein [Sphingomonas sp. Y38-1Y]
MREDTAAATRAIVGHVGRKGVRFALVDGAGRIEPGSIRFHEAAATPSIAGAITGFQREMQLPPGAIRSAIAVAGLVRGDSISVTRTRWFVSRSGLHAMLGHPPIILNDFEAEAWALAAREGGGQFATTHCIAGATSGLGVAVLRRDPVRGVTVLATEAGHAAFAPPDQALAEHVAALFPGRLSVTAEEFVSASGLVTLYTHLARAAGVSPRFTTPEAVTAGAIRDAQAEAACEAIAAAFAAHLGNLVLSYGAWDGVIVSGGLGAALRPMFARARVTAAFQGTHRFARQLAQVPIRFDTVPQGELLGAAEALRAAA